LRHEHVALPATPTERLFCHPFPTLPIFLLSIVSDVFSNLQCQQIGPNYKIQKLHTRSQIHFKNIFSFCFQTKKLNNVIQNEFIGASIKINKYENKLISIKKKKNKYFFWSKPNFFETSFLNRALANLPANQYFSGVYHATYMNPEDGAE